MFNVHRLILFTIPLVNTVVLSILQLRSLINFSQKSLEPNFGNMTLLVVAHPDDETMFFGPTILNLIESRRHLIILCLSDGGADKLGDIRRQEFLDVIDALGPFVTSSMVNDANLKDGMSVDWRPELVGHHIEKYIRSRNFPIQTIVTFDSYGVSGHGNHKSIYKATKFLKNRLKDLNIRYFYLNSVSLWRKYISFIDASITVLTNVFADEKEASNGVILAINFSDNALLRRLLLLHRSQMVWFRKLYMTLSRYMLINDLTSH